MYAAPFAYCRKEKYYMERVKRDKENKRVNVTDNAREDRGEAIERTKKIERLLLLYLICIPSQCLTAETVCPGL